MKRYIEPLELAEVLFLNKIMHAGGEQVSANANIQDSSTQKPTQEPEQGASTTSEEQKSYNYVQHKIVIKEAKHNHKEFGFDEPNSTNISYDFPLLDKSTLPNIVKQFDPLYIEVWGKSDTELDDAKTVDHFSTTGVFKPFMKDKKFKDSYYYLNVILDTNDSMFLWQSKLEHFRQAILLSHRFRGYRFLELDSSQNKPKLRHYSSKKELPFDTHYFRQENTLTLLLSDIVGKAWRNHKLLMQCDQWAKRGFFAIISLLPEHMWKHTPLRQGTSSFAKTPKDLPNNSQLKMEYDFLQERHKKDTKIPIIPYNDRSLRQLSQMLMGDTKEWINIRIFENVTTNNIDIKRENTLDAKTRIANYFKTATKDARHLAIYASVLPLHPAVLKELIAKKHLGEDIDAFAELYFGGLLQKKQSKKLYQFHTGVRSVLLEYISKSEALELFWMLESIIRKSFGVNRGLYALLYAQNLEGDIRLSKTEKELASLLLEILKDLGELVEHSNSGLKKAIDTIYLHTNSYEMGSKDGYSSEKPVHTITFDRDFAIAKYPVTFAEYDLYCEETGAKKPDDKGWGRGRRPVINVSWQDAKAYCDWLSKKSGKKYRLPTEAEWEYACRAGTATKWSFGDDESKLKEYAWCYDNSNSKTHEVGLKKPNPWGLYDMHGNVSEWCEDDWEDNYNSTPRDGSAHENKNTSSKVLRGGSWSDFADGSRSAVRNYRVVGYRDGGVGFRLLRTLP